MGNYTNWRFLRTSYVVSFVKTGLCLGSKHGLFFNVDFFQGGEQLLNLDQGCMDWGAITHELLHALGQLHEHTRLKQLDLTTISDVDPM